MIRINLLPHREQKRKAALRRFVVFVALFFGIGAALVGAGYVALATQISLQAQRNDYLVAENAKLDTQIATIETLKKEKQLLLDRTKVVGRLQSNRAETVKILDQLVRQTPEGIYFKDIKQVNDLVTILGFAQSAARVSTLMRSLNDSPVFEQPNLIEIRSVVNGKQRISEFNLTVKITREQLEDPKSGGKKDSGAKGKIADKPKGGA